MSEQSATEGRGGLRRWAWLLLGRSLINGAWPVDRAREGRVRLLVCSDPWRGSRRGVISWETRPLIEGQVGGGPLRGPAWGLGQGVTLGAGGIGVVGSQG